VLIVKYCGVVQTITHILHFLNLEVSQCRSIAPSQKVSSRATSSQKHHTQLTGLPQVSTLRHDWTTGPFSLSKFLGATGQPNWGYTAPPPLASPWLQCNDGLLSLTSVYCSPTSKRMWTLVMDSCRLPMTVSMMARNLPPPSGALSLSNLNFSCARTPASVCRGEKGGGCSLSSGWQERVLLSHCCMTIAMPSCGCMVLLRGWCLQVCNLRELSSAGGEHIWQEKRKACRQSCLVLMQSNAKAKTHWI